MKVLFLLKSDKTPSSRIRGLDLLPGLREKGFEADAEIVPSSFWRRRSLFRKCRGYEVTVLQKRLLSIFDFHMLRRNARKLVFDFDDAIYLRNASCSPDPADYASPTRMGKFKRTVCGSDLVIAANKVLAAKAGEICPKVPVRIIPSAVAVADKVKKDYTLSSPPVIGWVGTKSTLRYLGLVSEAFSELRSRRDFILRVISDEPYMQSGINVEFVRWSLSAQEDGLCGFDIGIMPLSRDPFSEGKSAYKLLQYLAAGVPSVCSPVGMNADVAGFGEYCLTASDSRSFCRQMEKLLDDPELRRSFGRRGRRMIEEKYSVGVVAANLAEALSEIHR